MGFNYPVWDAALIDYFDREFVWDAITDGVDIGWIDGATPTRVFAPYLKSSQQEQLDTTYWLVDKHKLGILLGPFTEETCPFPDVVYSPLFTVPKPDGKRRIVAHLSYPTWGVSVNDCINEDAKAVQYILFTQVAEFVYNLGYDARLWVVDAKDAYYRIPIKRKYWKYMGIKWFGLIFIFTSLQMGLGSACAIYQRFADAVLYIIRTHHMALFTAIGGGTLIHHYLDDFFGGHSNSQMSLYQILVVYFWFWWLGIPTKWKKLKWPHWRQIILGWLYDTRRQTVSLPEQKVITYTKYVTDLIRGRDRGVGKKQLEVVIGCLEHAAVAVFPGKAKLRHLQHALHVETMNYEDKIRLSDVAINELKWWLVALKYMNGIPLTWIFCSPSHFHDVAWSDAALKGELKVGGMGGCTKSGMAYQIDNKQTIVYLVSLIRAGVDIKLMEMVAVFILFVQFAPQWQFKNVKFYCDNKTVVSSLANRRAPLKRRDLHYFVDKIFELSAQYHFRFWIEHLDGDDNVMADRLSRFKKLYIVDQMDPNEFQYLSNLTVVKVVNDAFNDLLDFQRVPLNG